MAVSPDNPISLSLLAKHGMCDYSARAIEFNKPVGPQGLQADLIPTMWKVSITSLSSSRPTVIAIRPQLAEAEADARERFMMIFRDKRDVPPVSAPEPQKKVAPKPKPKAAVVEEDDDGSDLI